MNASRAIVPENEGSLPSEATPWRPVPSPDRLADNEARGMSATHGTSDSRSARRIRFGSCVIDIETRQLFVAGRETHVTPKAFELLVVLTEHAPKAITKGELIAHLWP